MNRSDAANRLERLLRRDLDEAAREAGPPSADEIDAYVAGRASAAEREVIESWLADDPALREEVDAVMAMRQAIESEAAATAPASRRRLRPAPESASRSKSAPTSRRAAVSSTPARKPPSPTSSPSPAVRAPRRAAGDARDRAAHARPAAPHRRDACDRSLAHLLHSLGRKPRPSARRIRSAHPAVEVPDLGVLDLEARAPERQALAPRAPEPRPPHRGPPPLSHFEMRAAKSHCSRTARSAASKASMHRIAPLSRARWPADNSNSHRKSTRSPHRPACSSARSCHGGACFARGEPPRHSRPHGAPDVRMDRHSRRIVLSRTASRTPRSIRSPRVQP